MSPRILTISHRNFHRIVWRCFQFEFEDVVCAVDNVELIAPNPRARGTGRLLDLAQRAMTKTAGMHIEFEQRPETIKLEGQYDLLFFNPQHPDDIWFLESIPNWRDHVKKSVCVIEELWNKDLVWQKMLDPLKQFDIVCAQHYFTPDALSPKIGKTCHWCPPGIDALKFSPWPHPPERTIDFYMMGRRSEATHQAMLRCARDSGRIYLRDTIIPRMMYDHVEHRNLLAETIGRTKFFMANRAKADVPYQTGQQEEVGFRFFEGAASGTVMIGDAPRSEAFNSLFGWQDAVIPFQYGSTNICEVLDDLERQPERLDRIRRENVVNSLRRHDWAYRWKQILELVDLPPMEGLKQRLAKLSRLADQVRGPSRTTVTVSV
jgi:Glycosyl transferases group 1